MARSPTGTTALWSHRFPRAPASSAKNKQGGTFQGARGGTFRRAQGRLGGKACDEVPSASQGARARLEDLPVGFCPRCVRSVEDVPVNTIEGVPVSATKDSPVNTSRLAAVRRLGGRVGRCGGRFDTGCEEKQWLNTSTPWCAPVRPSAIRSSLMT